MYIRPPCKQAVKVKSLNLTGDAEIAETSAASVCLSPDRAATHYVDAVVFSGLHLEKQEHGPGSARHASTASGSMSLNSAPPPHSTPSHDHSASVQHTQFSRSQRCQRAHKRRPSAPSCLSIHTPITHSDLTGHSKSSSLLQKFILFIARRNTTSPNLYRHLLDYIAGDVSPQPGGGPVRRRSPLQSRKLLLRGGEAMSNMWVTASHSQAPRALKQTRGRVQVRDWGCF